MKSLKIYLPTNELAKLKNFEQVTVLGKLTNVAGTPELKDAFLIDDYISKKQYTNEESFYSNITGNWLLKNYVDGDRSTFSISFTGKNTANVKKDDSEIYEWDYSFIGDKLKFGGDSFEVRKIADNLYVFYDDIYPLWILYRDL